MADIFLKIFNISITASYLVLAVLLLRLVLKKAPKWSICLLWGLVALRLVMPFSFESELSLIPSVNTVVVSDTADAPFEINTGVDTVDNEINDIITENKDSINEVNQSINNTLMAVEDNLNPPSDNKTDTHQQDSDTAEKTKISIFTVLGFVWLLGFLAMLIYSAISYLIIHRKVKVSLRYRDNIYYCDNIDTSFILGTFKPKIYIQSGMSQENTDYVIKHEKAHLKRCDHLLKPFAFLLLGVYWFNPLIWVAYILLCRDIESACDEKVIKGAEDIDIKGYSMALLNCGTKRKMLVACPVAFGEVSVKSRIKAVLKYKRPTRLICIIAIVASVAVALCFLTDPIQQVSALTENIEFETITEYIERTSDKNTSSKNQPSSNSIFNNILSIFDNDKNQNSSQNTENESQEEINSDISHEDNSLFVDSANLWYPVKDNNSIDSSSENESNVNSSIGGSDNNSNGNTQDYDSNSSQDSTTSEKEDNDTTSEDTQPNLGIKSSLFSRISKETNKSGDEILHYECDYSTAMSDWFLEYDYIHMALTVYDDVKQYVYVVVDTNTGNIVVEKPLDGYVGEIHSKGNEIWISYPELKCIKIYDKQFFTENKKISFNETIHSFDFYNDYIIYTESDQWVDAYRYNLITGEKVKFDSTSMKYNSLYEPDVLVNQVYGLVYLSESAMSGCQMYCYDIETLSLKSHLNYNSYGFDNKLRKSFLNGGYLYWGSFKLDPMDVSNIVLRYDIPSTAYGYAYGFMSQSISEYAVLGTGIHNAQNGNMIMETDYYDNSANYLMVSTSGNVMSFGGDDYYLEIGALN